MFDSGKRLEIGVFSEWFHQRSDKKIENKELGEGGFANGHVIHLEKELPSDKA